MKNLEDIYATLFSKRKIDRDQGVNCLIQYLNKAAPEDLVNIQNILLERIRDTDGGWETKHGALLGSKSLALYLKGKIISDDTASFLMIIYASCIESLLTDSEVRIRLAAGELLGALCSLKGPEIYLKAKDYVLKLISDNLERDCMDTSESGDDPFNSDLDSEQKSPQKDQRRRLSSDAAQIFHDTAGWKCLETSMKCLQCMVDGSGESFKPFITNDLLDLLFSTLSHTNRFVRETGYYVMASLVSCGTSCEDGSVNVFTADKFGHKISEQLGVGLSDNWSQVRLASSECARKFLLTFNEKDREIFFPQLLPKMCLNRYYLAEGVRIYSQQSWKLIVEEHGRALVKQYINDFVKHYISQTKANNHAVREAACACIAELASKVDKESTKPYVSQMLQTLVDCFSDDSWPVRDAACLACGNFVLCFPEESKCVLDRLYPLFFTNLKDGIPSVRQGAAASLANVVRAYGMEAFQKIKPVLNEAFKGVKDQPSESEKYGQIDKGPATFGVVKKLRDNDLELHTNQTMYSCGSLAPKMGRGGGGCSDHKFRKPSEPWEYADGCVHLLAEVLQIQEMACHSSDLLPLAHEAASYRHYTHHVCILESLCKQLPNICKGIGKKTFKQFLEMFLEDIFYSLTCDTILTSSAASQCLSLLSDALGPNILRARIENLNPRYLDLMDNYQM